MMPLELQARRQTQSKVVIAPTSIPSAQSKTVRNSEHTSRNKDWTRAIESQILDGARDRKPSNSSLQLQATNVASEHLFSEQQDLGSCPALPCALSEPIQGFRNKSEVDGEDAYCLTNLEAAIIFLGDGRSCKFTSGYHD